MSRRYEIPRIEMGNGAWARLADVLKATSVPCGTFLSGIGCYTHPYMPENMAVMIGQDGQIQIIDLRTDAERETVIQQDEIST